MVTYYNSNLNIISDNPYVYSMQQKQRPSAPLFEHMQTFLLTQVIYKRALENHKFNTTELSICYLTHFFIHSSPKVLFI